MSNPGEEPESLEERFQKPSKSTIKETHATLRCIASAGGAPVTIEQMMSLFADAESKRNFSAADLTRIVDQTQREGFVEEPTEGLYRLSENGRSEIGPIIEIPLGEV